MICIVSLATYAEEYYIEGTVQRTVENGRSYYTLHNPIGHGIDFDGYRPHASKQLDGSLIFEFYDVTTTCSEGLDTLRLEKWNEEENRWQPEVESKDITPHLMETKRTSIVLVLDVTSSLGTEGLEKVQNNAIEFLQAMLRKTGGNNTVHIGIIAFAGNVTKAKIRPLNNSTFIELKDFILWQQKGVRNTYLYRAVDEAVGMLENYTPDIQWRNQEFQGAYIITFTDGKDNGSESEDAMYFGDEYLQFVVSDRLKQEIEKKSIKSYVMSLRGADVSNSDIDKLKTLATTTDRHFKSVASFDGLQRVFNDIADSLKVTWYNLNCYTPQVTGPVRWVLDCEKPKPSPISPTPPVKPNPSIKKETTKNYSKIHEIGVIVGANNGLTYKIWNPNKAFAYQLDLAYNTLFNSFDCQSNFVWQDYIADFNKVGLALYAGGGVSVGSIFETYYYSDYYSSYEYSSTSFLGGLNAIIGLELQLYSIPFTFSFDYRPGVGMTSNADFLYKYADFNLGIRWYID